MAFEKTVILFPLKTNNYNPKTIYARVAQWIEQLPSKEKVAGPIPAAGTTKMDHRKMVFFRGIYEQRNRTWEGVGKQEFPV